MGERLDRVREMVVKEFRQLFRDPRMARILFVAPLLQLVVFGYAVSTEVRGARLFVVDQDGSRAARELVEAFTAGGYFSVVGRSDRPAELVRVLPTHGFRGLDLCAVMPSGRLVPARVLLLRDFLVEKLGALVRAS